MLRNVPHSPLLLAFAWSGLLACQGEPSASSKLQHQLGTPAARIGAWNWLNETAEEFLADKSDNPAAELEQGYISLDHPLTQHLQSRASSMFDALAKSYPEAMADVPRPRILVSKSSEFNAFASAKMVCLQNVSLEYSGGHKTYAAAALYDGMLSRSVPLEPCINRNASRAELEERLALNFPTESSSRLPSASICRYSIDEDSGNFTVRFTADCTLPMGMTGVSRIDQLQVLSVSNWLVFHRGLLQALSEDKVIAVLAHELAHYTRAHSTTGPNYGQAYYLNHPPEAPLSRSVGGPVTQERDETLRSVELALRAVDRDRRNFSNTNAIEKLFASLGTHAPVPGQKYHTLLASTLVKFVQAANDHHCNKKRPQMCEPRCSRAVAEGTDFEDTSVFLAPLTEDLRQKYLRFETEAQACLAKTLVSDPSGQEEPLNLDAESKSFPLDDTAMFFAKGLDKKLQLDAKKVSVSDVLDALNDNVQKSAPAYSVENVADFFAFAAKKRDLEQKFRQTFETENHVAQMTNRERLGVYSTEQEADQLSLEFLALAGFDPKAARDLWLGQPGSEVTTWQSCGKLFADGWRHQDRPFVVPIGRTEDHHQDCFRAFDLDQELNRHRYEDQYVMDAKLLPQEEWTTMVENLPSHSSPLAAIERARAKLLMPAGMSHDHY